MADRDSFLESTQTACDDAGNSSLLGSTSSLRPVIPPPTCRFALARVRLGLRTPTAFYPLAIVRRLCAAKRVQKQSRRAVYVRVLQAAISAGTSNRHSKEGGRF